ncbi:serine protease gd-like [Leptopilina heterotoma]|uniref:serine protease gd-like n=1 Tax=Leptopilina heterotoma TaxID=63436 RepID=UPI001CA904CC|nr:serine protease gd-like [Leptopilina heterotoma]
MIILFISFLLLAQSITIGQCQLPDSPCPKYFRYYYDNKFSEIMGIVEIPSPLPRKVPLMLRVTFNFLSILPEKHNGSLEFIKPQDIYAPVQQAIDEGKSLFYRLRFPAQQPLPFLKEIHFNNQLICVGPADKWPIVNVIDYTKILYPPEFLFRFNNQIPQNNTNSSLAGEINENIKMEKNCGTSKVKNLSILYLNENGEKTYPGQWPWLTAIFVRSKTTFEFKCTGSLVTQKHVISVAHCFIQNRAKIVDEVYVQLGKYYLDTENELESLGRTISEIRYHPDYIQIPYPHSDSDLAILVLTDPVHYTMNIQPICLWNEPNDLDRIIGKSGIVVGWGKYGENFNGEPQVMSEKIVSQEDCLRSNLAFVIITSNRTFCAGNRNGKGPCNGDSGSGLQILNSETGKYHLRGLVSLSLSDNERKSCDLNQYVVYTDLAKHRNWIENAISDDV